MTRYAILKRTGRVIPIQMYTDDQGHSTWFYIKGLSNIQPDHVHGPYWPDDKRFEILPASGSEEEIRIDEDTEDLQAARNAMKESGSIPWDDVKEELKL